MSPRTALRVVNSGESTQLSSDDYLDGVFFALSDPVRRQILERLDGTSLLVSELAEPFDMSLQAVSRHIQVLVRVGLVKQERTGRISRCALEAGPLFSAAEWLNRYTKYWQSQFDWLVSRLASPKRSTARRRSVNPEIG